jgi:hypothetical protein
MDAATVYRLLDRIPDRAPRAQYGAAIADIAATSCVHPERLALLGEFLHWLSPIYPVTRDDQMRLGLFAGHKPAHAEEDETAELEEETLV